MNPTKRNRKFNLDPSHIHNWHQAGPGVTIFLNSLSLMFPEGEKYFIRSVRAFKKRIPIWLERDVSNFIGQEAFHGREHQVLNSFINSPKFEKFLKGALEHLTTTLPDDFNLATTISLEHITAILAQGLLEDIEHFAESEPEFRDIWIWHALEETEHKAVAFDVYRHCVSGTEPYKYCLRSFALIASTAILMAVLAHRYVVELGKQKHLNLATLVPALKFLFTRPGIITKSIPRWLDWFKPNFHPWDHDNSSMLTTYKAFLDDK